MSTIADLLIALDACTAEAERLGEPLTEEQFHWQPAPSSWSVGHCLDHLAVTNRVYAEAIRGALAKGKPAPAAEQELRPGFIGRYVASSLEPPAKKKGAAPSKIVPTLDRSKAEILADFAAAQQTFREVAAACAAVDVNRTRFTNPFLKLIRFSLATGLLVTAAHERRHLWQAANVLRAAGFPR